MNRVFVRCVAIAVFGLGVLALTGSSSMTAAQKDAKITSVKEIMKKAHAGGNSILSTLKASLKKDEINWDAVQSKTKDLVLLAGDLGKNEVKKGEKESWEKLTTAYGDEAKKLLAATEKKDAEAANKSLAALSGSCMACHKAHK